MSTPVKFAYVGKVLDVECAIEVVGKFNDEIPISVEYLDTVEDLFPLLSNPYYYTDFINIDIESFQHSNVDIFSIIHTLDTLIKCTVVRSNNGQRPNKRTTKIGAIVGDSTPPSIIKQVMKMPDIHFVLPRMGGSFTYNMVREAVINQINNSTTPHRCITDLFKSRVKAPKTASDDIKLTTRQAQIMEMICSKGASNKVIARMLDLSESTVKLHVGHIFKKYGVKSRTQLAVFSRKK
jgi:two-component system nitrate/nitrite response regulator NarL